MAVDDIEIAGRALYGDMNEDNLVDADDLADFAAYWLQENCQLDLSGDCIINVYEFAEFARNWLNGSI